MDGYTEKQKSAISHSSPSKMISFFVGVLCRLFPAVPKVSNVNELCCYNEKFPLCTSILLNAIKS